MEHGDVFFLVCPWPRPGLQGLNVTLKMPYSLRTRNVILNVAPPDPVPVSGRGGQALYVHDICPENRDESNGNNIVRLWLQFIPIFGALHSQLCKGHNKKRHIHAQCIVSSMYNPEAKRRGYMLKCYKIIKLELNFH